ncbi:MAG: methionyl-tRNA formyltransferase [Candidatus Omnitrophica bacterium]|nr:methionyl-tRNA formyltransferase [Candidatus Omnitrophota bacterium]
MRILFFGTPDFAVPALTQLLESSHEVAAVVTQPDRPKGRSSRPVPSPAKEAALKASLPVLQPEDPSAEPFLNSLRPLAAEIAVVVAYGRLLSDELLASFPKGAVNLHPSLLPKYRGAAPIQWALIRGEKETGVTIFQLDRRLDHGPILLQVHHPIDPEDDAVSLSGLLADLGARTLIDALERVEAGETHPHPQNDEEATFAPPLQKGDGLLDWTQDCLSVHNRVRGVQPWPGAFSEANGKILKIFKTTPDPAAAGGAEPGTVLSADPNKGLWIQTGKGALRIDRLQLEGGREMDTGPFLRGHPFFRPGLRFAARRRSHA